MYEEILEAAPFLNIPGLEELCAVLLEEML